jgi:hypothetical protein
LYYLEDEDLARQLVENGLQGKGDTLSREEFKEKKTQNETVRKARQQNAPKILTSANKQLAGRPFLLVLAGRE